VFYDRQARDRHRPIDFEARQGYKIFLKKSVEKDFSSVPKKDLKKILDRIKALGEDPRPQGSEKLTGQQRYRLVKADTAYYIPYKMRIDCLGSKSLTPKRHLSLMRTTQWRSRCAVSALRGSQAN
jgi:mRNA interferase RelE/StbE